MEKMLVCDALDERDFLAKKILSAIQSSHFVGVRREKDAKVHRSNLSVEEFNEKAKRDFQSIKDKIDRYNKINLAITMSNAKTKVLLKSGDTLTVAEAIAYKKLVRESGGDFMSMLVDRLNDNYNGALAKKADYDSVADRELAEYKTGLVKGDRSRSLTEDESKAVESLVKGLNGVIEDPLNAAVKIEEMTEKNDRYLKELETALKVSNATTYIEF